MGQSKKLIKNAICCKYCNEIIESIHRQDYQTCSCGKVSVDGGLSYAKRSFPLSSEPTEHYEELAEYVLKDINYMQLNYSIVINEVEDESGSYLYGKIVELDGCHTTAKTEEELLIELENVKREHIEIKLEYGDPIPEPSAKELKHLNYNYF